MGAQLANDRCAPSRTNRKDTTCMSRPRCKTCARRGANCECGTADLMKLIGADREAGAYRSNGRSAPPKNPIINARRAARDAEYRKALGIAASDDLPTRLGTC